MYTACVRTRAHTMRFELVVLVGAWLGAHVLLQLCSGLLWQHVHADHSFLFLLVGTAGMLLVSLASLVLTWPCARAARRGRTRRASAFEPQSVLVSDNDEPLVVRRPASDAATAESPYLEAAPVADPVLVSTRRRSSWCCFTAKRLHFFTLPQLLAYCVATASVIVVLGYGVLLRRSVLGLVQTQVVWASLPPLLVVVAAFLRRHPACCCCLCCCLPSCHRFGVRLASCVCSRRRVTLDGGAHGTYSHDELQRHARRRARRLRHGTLLESEQRRTPNMCASLVVVPLAVAIMCACLYVPAEALAGAWSGSTVLATLVASALVVAWALATERLVVPQRRQLEGAEQGPRDDDDRAAFTPALLMLYTSVPVLFFAFVEFKVTGEPLTSDGGEVETWTFVCASLVTGLVALYAFVYTSYRVVARLGGTHAIVIFSTLGAATRVFVAPLITQAGGAGQAAGVPLVEWFNVAGAAAALALLVVYVALDASESCTRRRVWSARRPPTAPAGCFGCCGRRAMHSVQIVGEPVAAASVAAEPGAFARMFEWWQQDANTYEELSQLSSTGGTSDDDLGVDGEYADFESDSVWGGADADANAFQSVSMQLSEHEYEFMQGLMDAATAPAAERIVDEDLLTETAYILSEFM